MIKKTLFSIIVLTCLIMINTGCDIISPEPDISQIKSDLIGETLTQGALTWHFHALSEFKKAAIEGKIREADTIEYDVRLQLLDFFTGTLYTAEILMIYQWSDNHWDLFSILTMSLESSINDDTRQA